MIDVTRTTTALLDDLHDSENQEVWSHFESRYRPILFGFARKLGLSEADAADVVQDTLIRFVEEYRRGRYDRERGRLRSWLITIARTRVAAVYRARDGKQAQQGVTAAVDLSDEGALTQIWDVERRQAILQQSMEELRAKTKTSETTIQAFEMLVIQRVPPAEVAEQMKMSVHDVYLAKSRVAQRLRDIVARIEAVYDGEE